MLKELSTQDLKKVGEEREAKTFEATAMTAAVVEEEGLENW